MAYVKYNQALKACHDLKATVDPIRLQEIDDCNKWLVGQMGANLGAEDEGVHDKDVIIQSITHFQGKQNSPYSLLIAMKQPLLCDISN